MNIGTRKRLLRHTLRYSVEKSVTLQSKADAQDAPTPVTTYALFSNGEYLTNEQMNAAKFLKLVSR